MSNPFNPYSNESKQLLDKIRLLEKREGLSEQQYYQFNVCIWLSRIAAELWDLNHPEATRRDTHHDRT